MRPIPPASAARVHKTQIGLVYEGGALQRVSRALTPHVPAGHATQFAIDQGRQPVERRLVALPPRPDKSRDFGRSRRSHKSLPRISSSHCSSSRTFPLTHREETLIRTALA